VGGNRRKIANSARLSPYYRAELMKKNANSAQLSPYYRAELMKKMQIPPDNICIYQKKAVPLQRI